MPSCAALTPTARAIHPCRGTPQAGHALVEVASNGLIRAEVLLNPQDLELKKGIERKGKDVIGWTRFVPPTVAPNRAHLALC